MAFPAALASLAKGYLVDKALNTAGVPQGLPRDVISAGLTGGIKSAGKALVNGGASRLMQGDAAETDTYNGDTDLSAYKKGGKVKAKSSGVRGGGCEQRGKTRGRFV